MEFTEIAIVGGGPAGLMALMQALRDGLRARLITEETPGGLVPGARRIDNLLGQPPGSGREWCVGAAPQIAALAPHIMIARVSRLTYRNGFYGVYAADAEYKARGLILATGTEPAPFHLDVPKSPRLHRDLRSLPLTLRGQRVAVIGGGEAALDNALAAQDRHAEVRLFVRGEAAKASAALLSEARERTLMIHTHAPLLSLTNSATEWRLTFAGPLTWTARHLLLVVGRRPRLELLSALIPDIAAPRTVQGPWPGLFFAGDLLRPRDRFLAAALGDGQLAACLCRDFLIKESPHER